MSIAKIVEISAESSQSFEDAIRQGIEDASGTIRHIKGAWVQEQQVIVEDDKVTTCYRSVAEELRASGATYEDREVVVDGNLITSRQPSDLPAFMREVMKAVKAI